MNGRTLLGLTALLGTGLYAPNTQPAYKEETQKQPFFKEDTEQEIINTLAEENLEQRVISIEEQAEILNERFGYDLTGEDLAYITRTVYMEAGSDPKAKTEEDLKKGWKGVAQVILHRYLLNRNHGTHLFLKKGHENSIRAIVDAPNQFHGVRDNQEIFRKQTFYTKDGEIKLAHKAMDTKKAAAIYQTIIAVLSGEEKDITDQAVYFHGYYVENGRKDGTTAFHLNEETPCKTRLTTQINTHRFFGTNCPLVPYRKALEEET